jgi:exopolysaccharide biosynthesis protein
LPELANFLLKLGCTDAMNLDGGGSSTLWYDGKIRNHPCEGEERDVANSLVIVQKAAPEHGKPGKTASTQ